MRKRHKVKVGKTEFITSSSKNKRNVRVSEPKVDEKSTALAAKFEMR